MFTLRNIITGSNVPAESDGYKELITLSQGGRLQRACEAGRLFSACNATKVATTAGVTGTWTGLCISNLLGSGKKVIVHEFGWGLMIAADVAGNNGLMTGTIAAPAAGVTVHNCLDGESASLAVYADDGATIVTPLQVRTFGEYGTAATSAFQAPGPHIVDLKGSLILLPGRTVATFTTLATTACFQFHFIWEEIPA
jgi:hypothetical protein